jgi:hypothetical protein
VPIDWLHKNPKITALLLSFLFLFQAALFWPVTTEFFTPDAVYYLARQLDDWGDVRTVFTTLDDVANYRPLTYLATTGMYSWWKLDPFPYHVFTVLAHMGITALVFWLARLLLFSDIAGCFAAVFFGLHSAASRVAFGITFISDVLYAAFFIFAIIAFLKFQRGYGKHWIVLSLSSFLLSLMSKEPAVTLPAVLTVTLLLVPLRKGEKLLKWKECVRRTLPFWMLCFIYLGWFAFLSDGYFVPQDPAHPYHVSLTWETLRSKAQYLTLALNLGRFSTFADHPTIAAAASRLLPAGLAELFTRTTDFWLYLIGPVWMLWLVMKAEWQVLCEVAVFALATPFVVISSLVMLRSLFGRKSSGDPRTALYGLLFFVLPLLPVLILPADKTMLHNLYVPTVGLGIVVGAFVRIRAQQENHRLKRFMAPGVLAIVVAAGIYYVSFSLEAGWPTTSARAASKYLMDIQNIRSTFPKGAILYFERTGMPDWPFLTRGGDLFRVFYGDETLVTMFGDYGQAVPDNAASDRTVFRFREINGTLLPSPMNERAQ